MATQRGVYFGHWHLIAGKGSNPQCDGKIGFLYWSIECCAGGSKESGINFGVSGGIQAFWWWEGEFSFAISIFIVGFDLIGGREDGSGCLY